MFSWAWLLRIFVANFGKRWKSNEQFKIPKKLHTNSVFFPAWIFGNLWLTLASAGNNRGNYKIPQEITKQICVFPT